METGSFMKSAHTGHSRCNIQHEEEVLDAVPANPSTSTCKVAHVQAIFSDLNHFYVDCFYTKMWINLNFCAICCGLMRQQP
jgi:hypothetical protein